MAKSAMRSVIKWTGPNMRGKRFRVKGRKRRTYRRKNAKTSLTVRSLTGYPDELRVKLPYTFSYPISFSGATPSNGNLLLLLSGNGYPNVGGYRNPGLIPSGANKNGTYEAPTNLFQFGHIYGRALVTGMKLDIRITYVGAYEPYSGSDGWQGPLNNLLMEGAAAAVTAFPLDYEDSAGSFSWPGVSNGQARPPAGTAQSTGDVSFLLGYTFEELMSTPNTSILNFSSPLGSKSTARFKRYFSTKKFVDCHDLKDVEECSFSVPQSQTSTNGAEAMPARGFGVCVKGFAPQPTSGSGTGADWHVTGRATYYYTFSGRRPVQELDWNPT